MATYSGTSVLTPVPRITSIDALRGLVMFSMIFVNDLAGASPQIVPAWMRHFHGKSGMTFVDLVFPAFLFIVGMSIPIALSARRERGEPLWQTLLHVLTRTLSLLAIGILMVNGTPDSASLGWSGALWCTLMYGAAILAFCTFVPRTTDEAPGAGSERRLRLMSRLLRGAGLALLVVLALTFRGENGRRIVTLAPFSIHTSWYGILGLIGWAYLVGSLVFLLFGLQRTALLGCAVLLMCLYPADQAGLFANCWINRYVEIGGTLGSHASITVAGSLLGAMLLDTDMGSAWQRGRFTLLFIAGFAAGAVLVHGLYGINKNAATPSWCLWACAITGALWLLIYLVTDVSPAGAVAKPLALAGNNVFLAYLLSNLLPSALDLLRLDDWYGRLAEPSLACAVARSAGCAAVLLTIAVLLNRVGFRLRL